MFLTHKLSVEMRGILQIYVGKNINLVGAKHSGRYLGVKALTLLPECFAQIFMGDRHHSDRVGAKHFGRSSWLKAEIYYRNASPSIALIPIR
jgi:hypothetical protein